MQPGRIAKHRMWISPAGSCRSAAHLQRKHFPYRSFRDQPITVIDGPLVEAEWDMMRTFVQRMEREDLRRRFGYPMNFADAPTLRRAFDIKCGGGQILWLLDETTAIAGIAHRIIVSRLEAEIGLIVRSDLKRLGIGEYLLRTMLARSAQQGLKTLSGLVLWENRAMLRLAAKIGFVPREVSAWTVEVAFHIGRMT